MQESRETIHVAVERTLPAPWEREERFADVLHEGMQRSPAFAVSAVLHFAALMALAATPWNLLQDAEETIIVCDVASPLEELPPEPEPEVLEAIEPVPVETEPIPVPVDVAPGEEDPSLDPAVAGNDDARDVDVLVTPMRGQKLIGIGGGPFGSSKLGNRPTGGGEGGGGGRYDAEVARGLKWLADHQRSDGSWDVDGFNEVHACACTDGGSAAQDIGVTALALLAFTGAGSTPIAGPYRRTTTLAMNWLRAQQDPETGRIGEPMGHTFLYDHGLATLALCDLYLMTQLPMLERPCQQAVNFIGRARNPYGAWRYQVPPDGRNDTSVTGWMVFALATARDAGLKIDPDALQGALNWFDDVTDEAGRTGYDRPGGQSSRIENVNDHYDREKSEAMTAVALLCRFFLGQDPDQAPIMDLQADLVARRQPVWEPDAFACDMYAWYYATYAMFQMGGRHWKAWERSLGPAIADSQRSDGHFVGSWDPAGPWGYAGGRVYSTALMTLCLEVEYRYTRVR